MIIFYFSLILLLFILTTISTFLWAGVSIKIQGITYTKICIENFKNNVDFSKIIFFQKDHNFFYFFMFYFSEICNILLLIGFSIMWIFVGKNVWYIFGLIVGGILSHFFAYFLIKRLLKKMKMFKMDSTQKSISLFKQFLKNNKDDKKQVIEFILFKNDQKANRDFAFQLNLKRCQKRLKKINSKNLLDKQKILKILRTFIGYLKVYAVFLNTLQSESSDYKIKVNDKFENLDILKDILLNNFFFYLHS